MNKELYDEIDEQIPNPYYPNYLYRIHHNEFNNELHYFVMKNSQGYMHIFQMRALKNKIILQRYRFNKKYKLMVLNKYTITDNDEDVYNKLINIINNDGGLF